MFGITCYDGALALVSLIVGLLYHICSLRYTKKIKLKYISIKIFNFKI